ncbi:MAG: hypothetical protein HY744_09805 [Deltaproteobacteria bacterium]|nr:hypothetical protein [Deltaproteobacteria bacterium]
MPIPTASSRPRAAALVALALGAAAAAVPSCSGEDGGPAVSAVPSCAPTDPSCPALGIASDCLALANNAGKTAFTLRMAQLSVTKPDALAQPFVYGIVSRGVNINLGTCNVSGDGTFSWLLHFDRTHGKLRTGGAKPEQSPAQGYCFDFDPAAKIAPVEVDVAIAADNSFEAPSVSAIPFIAVPIYTDVQATKRILLPLHQVRITGAKLSSDQNCIGRFNAAGLDPGNNCMPVPDEGVEYFLNDAALEGHILAEEADTVEIAQLGGATLCAVLGGNTKEYTESGKRRLVLRDECRRRLQGRVQALRSLCRQRRLAARRLPRGAGGCGRRRRRGRGRRGRGRLRRGRRRLIY